jgi:seryl-tRNA synthetase
MPNFYHLDTPIGKSEKENVVIKQWGKAPVFDFSILDHEDL